MIKAVRIPGYILIKKGDIFTIQLCDNTRAKGKCVGYDYTNGMILYEPDEDE